MIQVLRLSSKSQEVAVLPSPGLPLNVPLTASITSGLGQHGFAKLIPRSLEVTL
jgi:hypothetical protein